MVPLENIVEFNFSLPELLEMAKGFYIGTTKRKEGIVVRPLMNLHSNVLKGRMSFKVVNNDYLLKDEE